MAVHHISDINSPYLAPYQQVRDRDALGPDGRPGLFIGESAVVIGAMLRAGVDVLSILTSDRHAERAVAMVDEARGFRSHMPDPQVLLVADDILDATVGFNIHRGFLAVGRRPTQCTVREVIPPHGQDALLLVVEEITRQQLKPMELFGLGVVMFLDNWEMLVLM